MIKPVIVAILDTMYGDEPGEALRFFHINPDNHSGRRLYKLVGEGVRLVVTNSCREKVTSAKEHGTPDPGWLAGNLVYMESLRGIAVVLVCGKVAQATYAASGWTPRAGCAIISMPHPAARQGWTRDYIAELQGLIAGSLPV